MNNGMQHLSARRRLYRYLEPFPSRGFWKRVLDYAMYGVGIVQPLALLPQMLNVVVHHETAGISLITWTLLGIVGCFWVLYGLVHREWPIVLSNTLSAIFDFAIAAGVFWH